MTSESDENPIPEDYQNKLDERRLSPTQYSFLTIDLENQLFSEEFEVQDLTQLIIFFSFEEDGEISEVCLTHPDMNLKYIVIGTTCWGSLQVSWVSPEGQSRSQCFNRGVEGYTYRMIESFFNSIIGEDI